MSVGGALQGHCLVETRDFNYDADFMTLFSTLIF